MSGILQHLNIAQSIFKRQQQNKNDDLLVQMHE
jgi:hypothetical protein